MRNYRNHNSFQNSRNFHINKLINNQKQLNSSKKIINTLDSHIDKWLGYSYSFLAPFFEDEDFQNSYSNNTRENQIDQEFDESLPTWIKYIINLLTKIYYLITPNKTQKKLTHFIASIFHSNVSKKKQNKFRKNYSTHSTISPPI